MERCMVNNCNRLARIRGNCDACDMAFRRMVAAGDVTDAELVDMGLRRERWSKSRPGCPAREAVFAMKGE